MSDTIIVQYIGFEAKALVREYTFTVREASESRDFTLTIANEAFASHRARYQDAPGICSLRLHAELGTYANHPPKTHYRITDAELQDYRDSRLPKAAAGLYARKAARDF